MSMNKLGIWCKEACVDCM